MRIHFSRDLIMLTHMLMSGSWHIYPAANDGNDALPTCGL